MKMKTFTITENGFAMDGSGRVAVPHCKITATCYIHAAEILSKFMDTRILTPDIELITPLEKIDFTQKEI